MSRCVRPWIKLTPEDHFKSGFGPAGASCMLTQEVGCMVASYMNIHRFGFYFVVCAYPDLLRPEQTRSRLV